MNEYEKILGIQIPKDTKISSVTNSSKKVIKDSIFFGLQGTKIHGSNYAEEAINLGASIAVHNDPNVIIKNKKVLYIKNLEEKINKFLDAFYKIDINSNNFFTFTGTNGKTSTAHLCHQLLVNMGYESIYIGTLGCQHNNNKFQTSFSSKTTPDIFELFEIISSLDWRLDSLNICLEISSHALDQKRLGDIFWLNSASILNIADEHLDYHKNISSYRDAKFEIFKINSSIKLIDEGSLKYSKKYNFIKDNDYELTCISNKNDFSDIFYKITKISISKSEFEILINNGPQGYEDDNNKKYKFSCKLFPEFNVSNLVFAICSIGFDKFYDDSINDLSFLKLPKGRLDFIEGIPVNIIIDFAHNEHSFNILLNSIKRYFDNLIVVFGCGGDRDKIKRSKMLKVAIENAFKIIFTSDNSRSENFEDIYEDAKYDNDLKDVIVIEDRKEAIIQGSKLINDNDCMLILGKGHEETQEINGIISHFSDYEVVYEIYS